MPNFRHDGVSLYYEVSGEGEPLVMLHGLGSSLRDWELNVPDLSRDHRVISMDLRGHGRSERPAVGYGVPRMAGDVVGLLDHLGVGSAHLVGLSMGGFVSLEVGVEQPRRVSSLVLCNTMPALVIPNWRVRLILWQRMALGMFASMRQIGRHLAKRMFPKPEQEELRRVFIERWAENDKKTYARVARSLLGWSAMERLEEVACRTLVLTGDRDFFPMGVKRALAERVQDGRLEVIADSGHATPADQPRAFNRAVRAFVAEATPVAQLS